MGVENSTSAPSTESGRNLSWLRGGCFEGREMQSSDANLPAIQVAMSNGSFLPPDCLSAKY